MSKEKQTEEMAKLICTGFGKKCDSCTFAEHFCCPATAHAEIFYNAGYRKKSEGEWEKRTFIIFDSEKDGYRCSECNTTWDTETPYCPNCGAKMRKEDEGK